jgi:hypothetical protein
VLQAAKRDGDSQFFHEIQPRRPRPNKAHFAAQDFDYLR